MPLPLLFDTFEAIVLFFSGLTLPFNTISELYADQMVLCTVLVANYILKDGKSNWMEGMVLICTFIQYCYRTCHFATHHFHLLAHNCVLGIFAIFAVTFCYYPGSNVPTALIGCGS